MGATAAIAAPYDDAGDTARRAVSWWAWVLAGALLLAAGIGGTVFVPPGAQVAVWWPAAGIAVGFALLQPVARIPAALALVLAATTAANAIGGQPIAVALAFGVANTVEVSIVLGVLGA